MGKVKTTWLLPGHSGRACNHEDIYTKQDKKTNKVYSVKLCNPSDVWTEKQHKQRSRFGIINSAISAWVNENKAAQSDAYKTVKKQYDRQTRYSTLRGMMYAKGMANIEDDGTVTITIGMSSSVVSGNSGSVTPPDDNNGSNGTF